MNTEKWPQIEEVLNKALELDEESKNVFLEKVRNNDPEIYYRVTELLDAIEEAEDTLFLEKGSSENAELVEEISNHTWASDVHKRLLGKQIGVFTLTEFLGRGGMAVVYKGERRDDSFNQTVAVKILNRNFYSEENMLRFRMEQQILSKLSHPNIAHLIDGGVTKEGNPYLVMEYVNGLPITAYCKNKNLGTKEYLALFKDLCGAVKYAHQNLVVHRDLKPENILVTDEGTVKVLDFSIAKLLEPESAGLRIIQTQTGIKLLSPSYCAPEQFQNGSITTATDVFSLGLLLYELATGRQAVQGNGKSLTEIESIICRADFAKPRGINPNTGIELEAIVMKALRTEPEYRYDSAGQMLEDLVRFEKSVPLIAKNDTLRYRVNKFMNRHQKIVAFLIIFLLTMLAFGSFHYQQIKKEKDIAERETEKANHAANFMVDLFQSANPEDNITDTLNVYDLLRRGKNKITDLNGQPALQIDLLLAIGRSYIFIGDYNEAEKLIRKADTLANQNYPAGSPQVAETSLAMGQLFSKYRQYSNAKPYFITASKIYDPLSDQYWYDKTAVWSGMGMALQNLGKPDSAEAFFQKALHVREKHKADTEDILSVKMSLALNYRIRKKYHKAEKIYREMLKKLNELQNPDSDLLSATFNNLGYLLKNKQEYEEAEAFYRKSLKLYQKVYGKGHPTTLTILNNLAAVCDYQGKFEESEKLLRQGLSITKRKFGATHWRTGSKYSSLGGFYFKKKKFEKAKEAYYKSYVVYTADLGKNHMWTGRAAIFTDITFQNESKASYSDSLFQKGYRILQSHQDNYSTADSADIQYLIENIKKRSIADITLKVAALENLLSP